MLSAVLRDKDGNMVDRNFSFTDVNEIYPGEKSPFMIVFMETPPAWETFEIELRTSEYTYDVQELTSFEVLNSVYVFEPPAYR